GARAPDLDLITDATQKGVREALEYLELRLATSRLLGDVESASGRVSALVTSIKSYSHMDRGGDRLPTDVRRGLDSTVTMLG
ncbi:hypothetical protein, partial [Deinococcus pimensis]|uniref:hypothetical protein n=1 Tax=Deinococcus pimensis TaxID=309888 RepID=UPI0005EB5369